MYYTYKEFLSSSSNLALINFLKSKKVIDNVDRVNWSKQYLHGKKILNVGCLNHDIDSYNFQHGEIQDLGKYVVGVDIIGDASKLGGLIEIGDITQNDTVERIAKKHGKFDVIFAGEIIEHLDNYILFFERVHLLLVEGGLIVFSTPNPFGLHYFLQQIFRGYLVMGNTDHKAWIDPIMLAFNLKDIFQIESAVWVDNTKSFEYKIGKIFRLQQVSANYQMVLKKI